MILSHLGSGFHNFFPSRGFTFFRELATMIVYVLSNEISAYDD